MEGNRREQKEQKAQMIVSVVYYLLSLNFNFHVENVSCCHRFIQLNNNFALPLIADTMYKEMSLCTQYNVRNKMDFELKMSVFVSRNVEKG